VSELFEKLSSIKFGQLDKSTLVNWLLLQCNSFKLGTFIKFSSWLSLKSGMSSFCKRGQLAIVTLVTFLMGIKEG